MGVLLWTVGVIDFLIALGAIIVLYLWSKRFYPVAYVLCAATYIFLVTYIIDAFELKAEGITIILFVSSILLICMGYITSKLNFPIEGKRSTKKGKRK